MGRLRVVSNRVDIAPTTLGLCGLPKPDGMAGTDLSHHRIDKLAAGPKPDCAYLRNIIPAGRPDSINSPYHGLVTRDGRKYTCFENYSWLMFDLNEDPYEQSNLARNNRYRAERQKLSARLRQWGADTGDKLNIPAR